MDVSTDCSSCQGPTHDQEVYTLLTQFSMANYAFGSPGYNDLMQQYKLGMGHGNEAV